MPKPYPSPPVIEALCEFRFVSEKPWDLTIPGLVYEKVKSEYPKRRQQMGITLEFRSQPGGIEQRFSPAQPRTQFYSDDESRLIQVGANLLVANQLKPYTKWADFRPRILEAFETYSQIATPDGIERIGLRYINRINVESPSIEIKDYFSFYPRVPPALPQKHSGFIARVEIPYSKDKDRLLVTLTSAQPEQPDTVSFVLDLDYFTLKPEMNSEWIEGWIDNAHDTIEEAFEATLTKKCKSLFGEQR